MIILALGSFLQKGVHQKVIEGPGLQGDTPAREEDQDHLQEDSTIGDTPDLLQGDTGETRGPGHLREDRRNNLRKFILISKSAERCLMRMSEKFSGMVSSG